MSDIVHDTIAAIHAELDRRMSVGGTPVSIGYSLDGIKSELQAVPPIVWRESGRFTIEPAHGGIRAEYLYSSTWHVEVRGNTVADVRGLFFNLINSAFGAKSARQFDISWGNGLFVTQAHPEVAMRSQGLTANVDIIVPVTRDTLDYTETAVATPIEPEQGTTDVVVNDFDTGYSYG